MRSPSSKPWSRAPHAQSAVYIVRDVSPSAPNAQLPPPPPHAARLKRDAAGDVIDLGAPVPREPVQLKRQLHRNWRHPTSFYTPNPRLYPGPQAEPKPRKKRTETRGNDDRGRRHKQVFWRTVPNARLYRPAPPRPPPPPAWPPRDSWPQPPSPTHLDTASIAALRLSEQRPRLWPGARAALRAERVAARPKQSAVWAQRAALRQAQSPLKAEWLSVNSARSLVNSARSPVNRARSPVNRARSPVNRACLPVNSACLPVTRPRLPVNSARLPVNSARLTVNSVRSPVNRALSPVNRARSPVTRARSPVNRARSPVNRVRSPVKAVQRSLSLTKRLVVTLPAPCAEPSQHLWPASEHIRLRSLDTDSGATTPAAQLGPARAPLYTAAGLAMDAANRHSTSPEDCSEGNETLSAPSEFLAEFLSAIMRRQYAEALKYCRLILQYEPHNATARGFYPLLQHKVQAHKRAEEGGWARGSSSEEASAHADKLQPAAAAAPGAQEMMEQGADEWEGSSRSSSRSRGSCASQSSLELDSSPSVSLSASAGACDSTGGACDSTGGACDSTGGACDSTGGACDSTGGACDSTGSGSRSEPDDNGNAPASLPAALASDLHNANEVAAPHKSQSAASSLRRLRAQFTCSIK